MASWNATTQAQPAAQEKEYVQSATPTVYERSRHPSEDNGNAAADGTPRGGVDVAEAEQEFEGIRRQLTRQSIQKGKDVEKQVCSGASAWSAPRDVTELN
jgi:hypothetical protein